MPYDPPLANISRPMNGRTIGTYELEGLLGEGGIGQVYAAHDTVLGRKVAIKMLRPELSRDRSFVERFYVEAKSLGTLNHSNVTTIYALHVEGDQAYMVMELVNGQTIEALLARAQRLTVRDALAVLAQAIPGIRYAHRRGVIHRDLKPANLMLTDDGIIKIMDFGIARVQGSQHLTQVGEFCGTFVYASPEQIRGEDVDERSDLYSLAIVFYRMIAGTPPFTSGNEYALMTAQLQTPPPPLAGRVPDLDPATEQALMRALAKRPEDRFRSVEEFGRTIGAMALRGESVEILTQLYERVFQDRDLETTRVTSKRAPSPAGDPTMPSNRRLWDLPRSGTQQSVSVSQPQEAAPLSSRFSLPAELPSLRPVPPPSPHPAAPPPRRAGLRPLLISAAVALPVVLTGGYYWTSLDEPAPLAPTASKPAPAPLSDQQFAAAVPVAPVEVAKPEAAGNGDTIEVASRPMGVTSFPEPTKPEPATPPRALEAARVDPPAPARPEPSKVEPPSQPSAQRKTVNKEPAVEPARVEPPTAPPAEPNVVRVEPPPPPAPIEPARVEPPPEPKVVKVEPSPPPAPVDPAKVKPAPQPPSPPARIKSVDVEPPTPPTPVESARVDPPRAAPAAAPQPAEAEPASRSAQPPQAEPARIELAAPVPQGPAPARERAGASVQSGSVGQLALAEPRPAPEPPPPLGPQAVLDPAKPEGEPDLQGRVVGAKRLDEIEVAGRWIRIFGIIDRARGAKEAQQVQALLRYLKPARNVLVCYRKPGDTYRCYADGQDIAQLALQEGMVQLARNAPAEYRALLAQKR